MKDYLKTMLKPLLYLRPLCMLLCNIVLARLTLPLIENISKGNILITAVTPNDVECINDIYKTTLGAGCDIVRTNLLILRICGNRMSFRLCQDNKTIGYMFFYFHLIEFIRYKRIHCASAAILPEYRKGTNGMYLYWESWNWFKDHTRINGISSRYMLSNRPARILHKTYGFKEAEIYSASDGEQWCYAVRTFNKY